MGSGMLGVTAVAWARASGAEEVIACDISPSRRAMASTFGATQLANSDEVVGIARMCTDGHGVDVAFEMTGAPEAIEALLPLIRMGGSLILVGSVFPSRPVAIAPEQLVRRCLTLRGIHNYAPRHLHSALEFLAAHPELPFAEIVAGWLPLTDLDQALSKPLPPNKLRIGVRPGA